MLKLDKLRFEIDIIDKSINDLINKRQNLANEIIKAKGNAFPFDPERETKLIKKIINYSQDPVLSERIWRQIISSNLARQKKLKIGILDNDKFTLAAFEVYFGPYFNTEFYSDKTKLFDSLKKNNIDIIFAEKDDDFMKKHGNNLTSVAYFPINGYFYEKKFSIIIYERNWGF